MTKIQTQAPLGSAVTIASPVKAKYCLYARKSTESEEQQVLSIDSQIKEMMRLAESEKLEIVDTRKESHSAKEAGQRPEFNRIVEDIKQGKFNSILTWAPDRISRNAGDLGKIVDLMDAGKLIEIRTSNQKFTNNPNEKFLLMILGSQAKLENDNRRINVKRGLRARVEMGLWPCVAPTGYLNSKNKDECCEVKIDPIRAPIMKQVFHKVAYEGYSGRKIFSWLKDEIHFKSKYDKPLTLSNVYLALRNHFYYGTFEYPRGSGNWYQGRHEPLISKELFDEVQKKITEQGLKIQNNKEFAFTRLMTCALCGSGITADEKWKKQKNGNVHRYVYYNCTKHNDKGCKSGYISESDLIEQLAGLMDKLDIDEIGMLDKIKTEIERHRKFSSGVLGIKETAVAVSDIDVRNYAKYILREGTMVEKRELLSCLKSKIVMSNKKVTIN